MVRLKDREILLGNVTTVNWLASQAFSLKRNPS